MADMQRIFTNCKEYNPPESEVLQMCQPTREVLLHQDQRGRPHREVIQLGLLLQLQQVVGFPFYLFFSSFIIYIYIYINPHFFASKGGFSEMKTF